MPHKLCDTADGEQQGATQWTLGLSRTLPSVAAQSTVVEMPMKRDMFSGRVTVSQLERPVGRI